MLLQFVTHCPELELHMNPLIQEDNMQIDAVETNIYPGIQVVHIFDELQFKQLLVAHTIQVPEVFK
jgi:hypothetical protein